MGAEPPNDSTSPTVIRHGPWGTSAVAPLETPNRPERSALQDWHRFWLRRNPPPNPVRMELRINRKLSGLQLASMTWMLLLCGSIALIAWALRSYLVAGAMAIIGVVASGTLAWWILRDYWRAKQMPLCLLSVDQAGVCRLYDGEHLLQPEQIVHLEYHRRRASQEGHRSDANRLSLWAVIDQQLHQFDLAAGRHDYRQHLQRLGIRLAAHTSLTLVDDPQEHLLAINRALAEATTGAAP